jgi:hypothetical protein
VRPRRVGRQAPRLGKVAASHLNGLLAKRIVLDALVAGFFLRS